MSACSLLDTFVEIEAHVHEILFEMNLLILIAIVSYYSLWGEIWGTFAAPGGLQNVIISAVDLLLQKLSLNATN